MAETTNDRVELSEEIEEVSREEAEERPDLRADPSKSMDGVLDDEDLATFEALELEAAEEILAEEESEAG